MISIDRVYKTLLFFVNSDVRGNVKPDELRLAINTAVNDIVEGYFMEVNRAVNRENRGLNGNGLENLPDRIREKIAHFRKTVLDIPYLVDTFQLPDDVRYLDEIFYLEKQIEPCRNMREFNTIKSLVDTSPTESYPIYVMIGNTIRVLPDTIVSNVGVAYLRKHNIANWTFNVIGGTEIFNPSAPDFQDIDLHSSEEYRVIIKTAGYFGINLKSDEIVQYASALSQSEFNEENAV